MSLVGAMALLAVLGAAGGEKAGVFANDTPGGDPWILIEGPFPPPRMLPVSVLDCGSSDQRITIREDGALELRARGRSEVARATEDDIVGLRVAVFSTAYWAAVEQRLATPRSCDGGARVVVDHPGFSSGYELRGAAAAEAPAIRRVLAFVDTLGTRYFGKRYVPMAQANDPSR